LAFREVVTMPSPFPGMNPYLEQRGLWRDFHGSFLLTLRTVLTPQVVPRYYVELEESLYIDRVDDRQGLFAVADAAVATPTPAGRGRRRAGPSRLGAPMTATIPVSREIRRHRRWLTIRDSSRRRVVAVVELLSPSDKKGGPDRERYLLKRGRVLSSTAHLIELDLLRGGERMPIQGLPDCSYYVMVSSRPERPQVGLWPLQLRDRLPEVPFPLGPDDPAPRIDLQAVLHRVYDEAGYVYRLYDGEPDPPLSADDAGWARGVLATG
jgi:hypothetical protein